jgi:hypothetical protein
MKVRVLNSGRRMPGQVLIVVVVVTSCAVSCSEDEQPGPRGAGPPLTTAAAPTTNVPTGATSHEPAPEEVRAGDTGSPGSFDVADVIRAAGRPSRGAVGPDGTALLVYTAQPGEAGSKRPAAFRIFGRRGLVTKQGLIPRPPRYGDYLDVYAYGHDFVLASVHQSQAWQVTSNGRVSRLRLDGPPTKPLAGDVLIGGGWIFRPSSQRVHRRIIGPPRATVTHVDGRGVWWALGEPENGQSVLYSATPGAPWAKQFIGPFSNPHHGCACDASPGPHGRGPVLVVTGDELSHVSLDYGQTWTTWNLGDSEPYRQTIAGNRFPVTSALPDGRIVIGYSSTGFWVGQDATNDAFTQDAFYPKRELWLAGLTSELLFRPGQTSPDGGHLWLPTG